MSRPEDEGYGVRRSRAEGWKRAETVSILVPTIRNEPFRSERCWERYGGLVDKGDNGVSNATTAASTTSNACARPTSSNEIESVGACSARSARVRVDGAVQAPDDRACRWGDREVGEDGWAELNAEDKLIRIQKNICSLLCWISKLLSRGDHFQNGEDEEERGENDEVLFSHIKTVSLPLSRSFHWIVHPPTAVPVALVPDRSRGRSRRYPPRSRRG